MRRWLIAGAVVVAVLVVLGLAPYRNRSSGCLFCGANRYESWWFGLKAADWVTQTECSRWIRGIYPEHSSHRWSMRSVMIKGWGLGRTFGCGTYAGGTEAIHHFRSELGEERTRDLLTRYHSALQGDPDSFKRFLRSEFAAALTNGLARGESIPREP